MAAAGPIRDEERLVSVAVLDGTPMGALAVRDPDGTAGIRSGWRPSDLGQPHRVVLVDGNPVGEIDVFFHAVSRAAREVEAGSLLAPRLHDVILLARPRAPWDQFRQPMVAELRDSRCRVGVGGRCQVVEDFPRSYREAELALRIQQASGGPEQVTLYDDLGVYKILAAASDTVPVEHFVDEWLARLIGYDSAHGTQLVLTLSEHLECGGTTTPRPRRSLCTAAPPSTV